MTKKRENKNNISIEQFKKVRWKLFRISVISIVTTLAALAIVGLKVFYPFHLVLGIGLYILSFIPIIRRLYLSRKTWQKYGAYKYAYKFFKRERLYIILGIIFVVVSACFLWLQPLDQNPFEGYSREEIHQMVEDDLYKSITAMDYLETTGNDLLIALNGAEENSKTISDVTTRFNEFLKAVSYSEYLTDVHRYFNMIPYSMSKDKEKSFVISYSLYVKKYEIMHKVMQNISGRPYLKTILNQYVPDMNRSNVYNEMILRFYAPKTKLRLTFGYLYMKLFGNPDLFNPGSYELLYSKAIGSYSYLRSNFLATLTSTGEVLLDGVENKMSDTWFPIQKTVANAMGKAILTTRGKDGLISDDQAKYMDGYMEPGDFMLQRRNWHLSNVGIPGFWTHAAFYTGDMEKMNSYFASEFPYEGYEDFDTYTKSKFPDIYKQYIEKDKYGNTKSVIEAIDPRVLIQSIERSADADSVVVLRPKLLSKKDKMLAVFRAFTNVGKPYDYNFDFDTLDALVCSEVVYDAYHTDLSIYKKGLNFVTSLVSGRKMVTPLDIAKKFVIEESLENQELSFVYFLKGNEVEAKSTIATKEEFLDSINWSKFTFLQK
jgi:hypothetical protein